MGLDILLFVRKHVSMEIWTGPRALRRMGGVSYIALDTSTFIDFGGTGVNWHPAGTKVVSMD